MFRIEVSIKDKDLGEVLKRLHGLTTELEYAYIPDHVKPKGERIGSTVPGNRLELIEAEIHRRKLTKITGPEARELVEKIGLNPSSYSHFLQTLVDKGTLKKGGKGADQTGTNVMTYIVTGK